MKKLTVLIVVLLLSAITTPVLAQDSIVGTWKLVTIDDPKPNPQLPDVNPSGYIMYDATGHMSMQMTRRQDIPKFKAGNKRSDVLKATHQELMAAFNGYGAYYGRYIMDTKNKTVTHILEGSIHPNIVGMKFTRYYEISGNRLILIPARIVDGKLLPKQSPSRSLTWELVK